MYVERKQYTCYNVLAIIMIQRLGSDVISELRSGVTLSCLSQCVEEMVLNAIDAGSSNVTIDVDVLTISLEVSDNGTGMCQSDLKNVGQRYFTSKCNSIKDLQNNGSYGFRGEALASLCKVCQKVEIISRHKSSNRTYHKLVNKGVNMGVYESSNVRPMCGSTIKVFGVFYNQPVRQKLISEKIDLEQIRRHVVGLALINPDIAFIVRNQGNGGTVLFQTHACTSALSVISQILTWGNSKLFKPVSFNNGLCSVNGFVNLQGLPNSNFQFFYVNKRLVLKTRFHSVANHMLARPLAGLTTVNDKIGNEDQASGSSRNVDRNVGFVLNLGCPHHFYDITFDPKKTQVQFQNWEEPISCLKGCLSEFLMREGIFDEKFFSSTFISQEYPSLSQEPDLDEKESKVSIEHPNLSKRPIDKLSDLQRSLHSSTAKRKRNENVVSSTTALWPTVGCHVEYDSCINTRERYKGEDLLDGHLLSFNQCLSARREPGISCHVNTIVSAVNMPETLPTRSIRAKLQAYSVTCGREISSSNSTLHSNEGVAATTRRPAFPAYNYFRADDMNMPETSSQRLFLTRLQGYSGTCTSSNRSPIASNWTSSSSSNSNDQPLPKKIERGFQELHPVHKMDINTQVKKFHLLMNFTIISILTKISILLRGTEENSSPCF